MAPLPTSIIMYNNVAFVGRTDATWAAFFDLCGWRWRYRPHQIDNWTPAFQLEGMLRGNMWVDVYPIVPSAQMFDLWQHRIKTLPDIRQEILGLAACPRNMQQFGVLFRSNQVSDETGRIHLDMAQMVMVTYTNGVASRDFRAPDGDPTFRISGWRKPRAGRYTRDVFDLWEAASATITALEAQ